MGLVSISFYKTYYYFIFVWILDTISALIKLMCDYEYREEKYFNRIIELFYIFFFNIGDLLAGFLVLYTYIKSQPFDHIEFESERISQINISKSHIELIYTDLSIKKNKYCLILLISILEFIARSIDLLYFLVWDKDKIRDGEISWLISVDILSRMLFSRLILKRYLYKHHILSIVLAIIGLFSMSISAFIAINGNELDNWPYFIFIAIKFILLALEDVFNKVLLTDKFMLPHTLMLWRGIFYFLLFIITTFILFFTKLIKYEYISENHHEIDINLIISLIIIFILSIFLKSFFTLKVVYLFTPQHVAFLNVVFYLFRLLRCRILSGDKAYLISADVICLIMIIFSTLLFNEMIIINSCGLGENTKNGFLIKEKDELISTNTTQYNDNEEMNENKSTDD